MRSRLALLLAAMLAVFALLAVAAVSAPPVAGAPQAPATTLAQPGNAYIHLSNTHNITGDSSYLDDLSLNGSPAARFLIVNVADPYGDGAAVSQLATGVWFNNSLQRWAIYNENLSTIGHPLGWNVFVPPADDTLILHTSSVSNTVFDTTFIDDPQLNNHPEANLFVQHVYNPNGLYSTVFTPTLTLVYSTSHQKWALFRNDDNPMPNNISFFVLKASADETAYRHTASLANLVISTSTELDNPLINGQPDAMLLINNDAGVDDAHPTSDNRFSLRYDGGRERWLIVSQNPNRAIPVGMTFNVLIIPLKTGFMVHTVTESGSYHSLLDAPDLNDNPYARVYVMHNYNPPEASANLLDDHPVGVFYNTATHRWQIFNRDYSPLPHGATFNVYYTWPRGNSFAASASPESLSGGYLRLNNPLLDARPAALALTTFTLQAGGINAAIYTPTTGLFYDPTPSAWGIFNNEPAALPDRLTYNVLIPSANSFQVTSTVLSRINNQLIIDNPLTNGDPLALVFATPRGNPLSLDNENLGVFWTGTHWGIYEENTLDTMPLNLVYNVFVIKRYQLDLPLVRK